MVWAALAVLLPLAGGSEDPRLTELAKRAGEKSSWPALESLAQSLGDPEQRGRAYFVLGYREYDSNEFIPAGRHFCLYALQAALPLLPAKQRALQEGDWLKEDCRILCPDPAGNVILRIDEEE